MLQLGLFLNLLFINYLFSTKILESAINLVPVLLYTLNILINILISENRSPRRLLYSFEHLQPSYCSPRHLLYFFKRLQSSYCLSRCLLYSFETSRRALHAFNRYLSTDKIQLVLYLGDGLNSETSDSLLTQNKISVGLLIFDMSISVLIPTIKDNILFCIDPLCPQI